jgi:hypothetical protein
MQSICKPCGHLAKRFWTRAKFHCNISDDVDLKGHTESDRGHHRSFTLALRAARNRKSFPAALGTAYFVFVAAGRAPAYEFLP